MLVRVINFVAVLSSDRLQDVVKDRPRKTIALVKPRKKGPSRMCYGCGGEAHMGPPTGPPFNNEPWTLLCHRCYWAWRIRDFKLIECVTLAAGKP